MVNRLGEFRICKTIDTKMTKDICTSVHYFPRPNTEIVYVDPEKGLGTIEGFYDE